MAIHIHHQPLLPLQEPGPSACTAACTPRDSHDLRVLADRPASQAPAFTRLHQYPTPNSGALLCQPMGEANELRIVARSPSSTWPAQQDQLALDPAGRFLPFAYSVQAAPRPRALPRSAPRDKTRAR